MTAGWWVDVLAGGATLAVLLAYWCVATGAQPVRVFHIANVIGAVLIGASAALHHAWPSFALTVAFGVIGAVGLVRG